MTVILSPVICMQRKGLDRFVKQCITVYSKLHQVWYAFEFIAKKTELSYDFLVLFSSSV